MGSKTKIDKCINCKKILNTKLPEITNEEIILLSTKYIHKELRKIIIPNAFYSIIYKNNIINIELYKSILFTKKIIKNIKNNEYCYFLNKKK